MRHSCLLQTATSEEVQTGTQKLLVFVVVLDMVY